MATAIFMQIILFLCAWFTGESVGPNIIIVTALDPELKEFMSGKVIRVTALHVLIINIYKSTI